MYFVPCQCYRIGQFRAATEKVADVKRVAAAPKMLTVLLFVIVIIYSS